MVKTMAKWLDLSESRQLKVLPCKLHTDLKLVRWLDLSESRQLKVLPCKLHTDLKLVRWLDLSESRQLKVLPCKLHTDLKLVRWLDLLSLYSDCLYGFYCRSQIKQDVSVGFICVQNSTECLDFILNSI